MVKPMPASLQPPHRAPGAIGQTLVLGHQRAVDIGDDQRDAGHERFPVAGRAGGSSSSLPTISSTIASTGASIETVDGIFVRARRLQRLELAVQQSGRHEMTFPQRRACRRSIPACRRDRRCGRRPGHAPGYRDRRVSAPSRRSRHARRALQTRSISSAIACSHGQRSSSVRGWPALIFSTLLLG